ncbi:hypothetical protein os4_36290 (plasmid) [Comamonadaceae bacterium OS-4]|nr:hypothetical protein os4_36290 [Comamonadaceae bacterium OS-4]
MNQTFKYSLVAVAVSMLGACGGGGGGGGSSGNGTTGTAPDVKTLSGTAAIGAPIVGGAVAVRCTAGQPIASTVTNSNGGWSVDVADQTLPCAVALTGGTANGVANTTQYHSIATARGVVNITPLTDLLVANVIQSSTPPTWFSSLSTSTTTLGAITASQVAASLQRIRNAVPLITQLANLNPITDSFSPVNGDAMDDILEAIAAARTESGYTHATNLISASAAGAINVSPNFYTSLVWKFRGTATGGNTNRPSSIVTAAAPAPSYGAGSEELQAFNLLNAERTQCGFGTINQNAYVDAAAIAHANWMLVNWVYSHFEDQSAYPTGFTGTNGGDRIRFQGYTDFGGYADNISIVQSTSSKAGRGVISLRTLMSAPFHARTLLDGYRDFGVGIRSNTDTGTVNRGVFAQYNLAYTNGQGMQYQASSEVLTYPCQGTSGVNYRLTGEDPNPVPGRNLATNPLGHPIIIKARAGNSLQISSATMTVVGTGANVALRGAAQTKADDTTGKFLENEAYVIPDGPLAPNTTYRVLISGTNAQVPFSKDFQFSTGSGG